MTKSVCKGARSQAMLMTLSPGQEIPPHPHDSSEVLILPQKGQALLTLDRREEIALLPGSLYYEEAGHVFGIKNTEAEDFQAIVILARVEG